mmetsp:Transcript_8970/g.23479  ORF Transcript_8970/g.23479 Transcript_8970/m.23479 type:complete len:262 (-) Transcript_8970:246-1031(-)
MPHSDGKGINVGVVGAAWNVIVAIAGTHSVVCILRCARGVRRQRKHEGHIALRIYLEHVNLYTAIVVLAPVRATHGALSASHEILVVVDGPCGGHQERALLLQISTRMIHARVLIESFLLIQALLETRGILPLFNLKRHQSILCLLQFTLLQRGCVCRVAIQRPTLLRNKMLSKLEHCFAKFRPRKLRVLFVPNSLSAVHIRGGYWLPACRDFPIWGSIITSPVLHHVCTEHVLLSLQTRSKNCITLVFCSAGPRRQTSRR